MNRETHNTYKKIRDQCFKEGKLFEDQGFPANNRSLMQRGINPNITWKRPHEIVEKPVFIREASYYDLNQGDIGNCWFICGLNSLIVNSKRKFQKVVPPNQSFEKSSYYAGIFHFRFWRFGKWVEVLVDDRLPVHRGTGKLVYCHNIQEPDEFWSPLVEKAYAKLNGCYQNLSGGLVHNALADMTGGLAEKIYLKKEKRTPKELFLLIDKMWKMDTLIGVLIFGEDNQPFEKETEEGLFTNHAYAVTKIVTVLHEGETEYLIRLRNPWGKSEWKGKWSDNSKEWKNMGAEEKAKLGLTEKNEGEFWMTFKDVMKYFDLFDLCHQDKEAFVNSLEDKENKEKKDWNTVTYIDSWKRDISSGGSDRKTDSYWSNPQFLLDLVNEKDETPVIISLMEIMEKNRNRMDIFIGFDVHRIKKTAPQPLSDDNYSEESLRFERRAEETEWRENTKYLNLKPGKYVIIPYTQIKNKESRFLLRVFSQTKVNSSLVDQSPSISNADLEPDNTLKTYTDDTIWMDAFELYDFIKPLWTENKNFPPLTLETARCFFSFTDEERLGVIGPDDAEKMKQLLSRWHVEFQSCVKDNSNKADIIGLKRLYSVLGVDIGRKVFETVTTRYADKDNKISFDDFVQSAVKLLNSFWVYKKHVSKNRKSVNIMKWMELMLYI